MITRFDKSARPAYFKKKFAESIEDCDFESALDYLLKYSDETQNPDFHLACGMLYLQLALDSDDNELLTLAYRELMMHIRRFPDCQKAYRDLLAALLLRRDGGAFIENCKWVRDTGLDFERILGELSECGALFSSPEDGPPDFDMLFDGEYGEIDINGGEKYAEKETSEPETKKSDISRIIAFDGGAGEDKSDKSGGGKLIQLGGDSDDGAADDFEEDIGEEGEFNDFINAYLYGDEYEEQTDDDILSSLSDAEITVREERVLSESEKLIRKAESQYESGDLDGALATLGRIRESDEQYYFALTMRALVNMEYKRFDEAERLLDEAEKLRPGGALGGSLLCQLYEYEKKTELIPETLKRIDVRDYVNSAHLYKSFYTALRYCDEKTAAELIKSYIDEFNILEMRLVYAQIMYNLGDRDLAKEELYYLSRIFYDDVNAKYFYLLAKSGVKRFDVDTEAPQGVLGALVENFMAMALADSLPDEALDLEIFRYGMEFFTTLEFRNGRKALYDMFGILRRLACDPRLKERVLDELVSPYVEPIAKAIMMGELLANEPGTAILASFSYVPFSTDDAAISGGFSAGYYYAYAFVAALCRKKLNRYLDMIKTAAFSDPGLSERDKAYCLFDAVCGKEKNDDRLPYAFGYSSKAEAKRALGAAKKAFII